MSRRWSVRGISLLLVVAGGGGCKRISPEAPCPPCEAAAPVSVDVVPVAVQSSPDARVVALDLDGDGKDEIALVGSSGVTLLRLRPNGEAQTLWSSEAKGGVTAVAAGDIDRDGREDLVVGWGRSRDHLDAPATLVAYLSSGADPGSLRPNVIPTPNTARAEFTALSVTSLEADTPGVLYALFVSKYEVSASFATFATTWEQRQIGSQRMGAHWVAVRFPGESAARVVAGRPYGDGQKSFGDVLEWTAEPSARRTLPSVRGVRSLAAVEVGRGPRPLVCFGAGWHWRYGEQAKGILTCAHPGSGGAWEAQIVDELGSYEVSAIAAGDLDGDGNRELVAQGPDGLYAYTPKFSGSTLAGATWQRRTVGPGTAPFAVADLDGDGRAEIVTGGAEPRVYRWGIPPARVPGPGAN